MGRAATHRSPARFIARLLRGARPASYPGLIEPCLAMPREAPPLGDRWIHEIKFDGLPGAGASGGRPPEDLHPRRP
jgi:ATP-dependent DNA ligase